MQKFFYDLYNKDEFAYYQKIVELYPDTERARKSREYLEEIESAQ